MSDTPKKNEDQAGEETKKKKFAVKELDSDLEDVAGGSCDGCDSCSGGPGTGCEGCGVEAQQI